MRIALISYEAPPDTLVGGIGTYIGQAARTLVACGHEVEVFAGSPKTTDRLPDQGYLTHRLQCGSTVKDRLHFRTLAGRAFTARHAEMPFDVLEGPDFLAEAGVARELVPDIPLVVKLHMSMTLVRQVNAPPMTPWRRIKLRIKGSVQPMLKLRRWNEFDYAALERPHLASADEITAPCREMGEITARMWQLDRAKMAEVPNPFAPPSHLLEIPIETATATVGYVGRLEQRKGVIELAKAIPLIMRRHPATRFTFAGASEESPIEGVSMQEYLTRMLAPFQDRISYLGRVAPAQLSDVYRSMDICVLPSRWENFPNTCLEAMSAGRGVVGSSAGGMAQQLDGGRAGMLVRPGQPDEIAQCVCRLLENPGLRMEFGRKARTRVLSEYNSNRIGTLMVQSYERAISRRRASTSGHLQRITGFR